MERKLATILFADLVGSTALGEELDPEYARDPGALPRRYGGGNRARRREEGAHDQRPPPFRVRDVGVPTSALAAACATISLST